MKIRIIDKSGAWGKPGSVVDVNDDRATRWIEMRVAVPVGKAKPEPKGDDQADGGDKK